MWELLVERGSLSVLEIIAEIGKQLPEFAACGLEALT
jgi:hypothetical protein